MTKNSKEEQNFYALQIFKIDNRLNFKKARKHVNKQTLAFPEYSCQLIISDGFLVFKGGVLTA